MPFSKERNAELQYGRECLGREWEQSKIFWLTGGLERTFQEVDEVCKLVHATPHLPWPDKQCIIAAEGYPPPGGLTLLARHGDTNGVTWMAIGTGGADMMRRTFTLEHCVLGSAVEYDKEHGAQWALDGMREAYERLHVRPGKEARMREWLSQIASSYIWGLPDNPVQRFWTLKGAGIEGLSVAHAMIQVLANLVAPCGYRMTQRRGRGIGNGKQEQRTRNTAILHHVAWDRLYKELIGDTETLAQPREPHDRSGHWRYLWKKAGIDRRTEVAGKSVGQRIHLAWERRVSRVYVNPCWVGERHWCNNGDSFEIHSGDEPA